MSQFTLKVKTKSGQHMIKSLKSDNTIKDLKSELSNLSNIPVNQLYVLSGFPPKELDISVDSLLLDKSGLRPGETLILEAKSAPVNKENKPSDEVVSPQPSSGTNDTRAHTVNDLANSSGILMKKVVPADNSCLFGSIFFVLNGKLDDGSAASYLRQVIAETIAKDTANYNEAILGKPNDDYCKWILNDKSWGGAIELAILSNFYGIEIAVVDTINAIINRFGEDQQYPHRVFLMFDGIHYDPLYLEPFDLSAIQTIFPSDNEKILEDAQQLAREANSSRQFTDVNKFTLKCLVCNVHLSGQVQAQQHAKSTGHTDFGEV